MKIKITALAALFGAGVFASMALAHGGPGHDFKGFFSFGDHKRCDHVVVVGSISPQTLTVKVDGASKKLNVPAGSSLALQVGTAGQTVRLVAEGCQVTTGSSTAFQVKELHIKVRTPRSTTTGTTQTGTTQTGTTQTGTTQTGTTQTTTTSTVTTSSFSKKHRRHGH
jgi:hypothetical protein